MSKKGKNMSKPKTYVAIVLDSSGSMASTKQQTVRGFNEQVQQAKANAKDKDGNVIQDIECCLVTFNGEVFEHQWLVPVDQLQEASHEDYQPSGATAMRDAIGYTIDKLLATTNPDDPNVAYFIHVVSDGEENQSKHYSVPALRELMESVERRPNFTVSYLGCDKRYLKEVAAQTGIPISNMAAWNNLTPQNAAGGWSASNKRTDKLYKARARGVAKLECLYSEDSAVCADFSDEVADTGANVGVVDNSVLNNAAPCPLVGDTMTANGVVTNMVGAQSTCDATPVSKTNIFGSNMPVNWANYKSSL